MKVKDLKRRLIGENDDIDIVIMLTKSDVNKINKIAKTEPAVLLLDTDVSQELVDNMLPIFIKE